TGNAFAQALFGNAGANSLNGGGGADSMVGFAGDDIYYVDNSGDRALENSGEGNDRVFASVSYTLEAGASIELMTTDFHAGTGAINFTGNELANTIFGNDGVNTLSGGGGADVLIGFGGNDILDGGAGIDTTDGGAGDDWHYVDNAADVVQEAVGGGADRVFASVSYTLGAGVEVEIMSTDFNPGTGAIDLTGNALAQAIYGNAGVNTLNGGGGNDVLIGGSGADTFAFTTTLGAGNVDTIVDFNPMVFDLIRLAGGAGEPFAALAAGFLQGGTVRIGTAALDDNDYLIYDSTTGAVFYDADGNGAAAAVQFATVSTGLNIGTGSFEVSGPANNAPTITSGATASVAENSPAGTIVYQLVANDADGDRITYSLGGLDSALLTMDASGAVRLINPANFEAKSSYSFTVFAADSNTAGVQAVTLTITDVAEGAVTPTINETAAINDSTGAAQTIDRNTLAIAPNPNLFDDDLPSATIIGSISANSDKDFFRITLQAGELLILDIDGTTNSLDSFLTLYDGSGQVIGDNDDLVSFDPGSNPPFGHNTDSQIRFRAGTGGTYYFAVSSFEGTSSGDYQLHVSIGPAATAQQIQAEDIEALISGAAWNDQTLTFGFPTSPADLPSDFSEVMPPLGFEAFNPVQQAATIQLIQFVQNVTTLTFTQNTASGPYTTPGTAASADLRYAESNEPEVAYAYYPNNLGPGDEGGSAWFNHTDFNNPERGNYAWMGILHETGHALGLKHGHEFPAAISANKDTVEYTVMTYRSYPGGPLGYRNETFGYPQTLMMYDIAALQKIYDGANYTFNAGNSVYTWSTTTGEMSINGAGQGTPGANRVFLTVWDGGGTDTYDLSAYATATTIDLRPGEWTTTSAAQLAGLGQGNVARGNVANALMFEGNSASLIENAIGGSGQDTLIANQVANSLTGNAGSDLFRWMASGDAGTGALADTITDFLRGTDKIDLSAIDAIPATGGNDDFTFIGTTAFHNVAGEVRYEVTGGHAHVFADLDGNGTSDMEIIVSNVIILAGTDFNF
ncbi:MAG TPA: DVUA0089 family protein, partial [Allosphingosinicella sp.]|nr:DVUA0089 family protein [Allosphingosinicella sp.]